MRKIRKSNWKIPHNLSCGQVNKQDNSIRKLYFFGKQKMQFQWLIGEQDTFIKIFSARWYTDFSKSLNDLQFCHIINPYCTESVLVHAGTSVLYQWISSKMTILFLTQCCWDNVMFTVVLFCEMHLHIYGSTSAHHQIVMKQSCMLTNNFCPQLTFL